MHSKWRLWPGLMLSSVLGTSALAKEQPGYDAFLADREVLPLPVTEESLRTRGAKASHVEERLGVPTFLWSSRPRLGTGARGATTAQPAERG